jgi:hypothetical protein
MKYNQNPKKSKITRAYSSSFRSKMKAIVTPKQRPLAAGLGTSYCRRHSALQVGASSCFRRQKSGFNTKEELIKILRFYKIVI